MNWIKLNIFNWWLRLSKKIKVATILVFIFFVLFLYKSAQNYFLRHQLEIQVENQEKQVEIYKDSLKVSQRRVDLLLNSAKEENQRAIKRSKKIDKKLKDDKKKIYNTPISDDELRAFVAEYERRATKNQNK